MPKLLLTTKRTGNWLPVMTAIMRSIMVILWETTGLIIVCIHRNKVDPIRSWKIRINLCSRLNRSIRMAPITCRYFRGRDRARLSKATKCLTPIYVPMQSDQNQTVSKNSWETIRKKNLSKICLIFMVDRAVPYLRWTIISRLWCRIGMQPLNKYSWWRKDSSKWTYEELMEPVRCRPVQHHKRWRLICRQLKNTACNKTPTVAHDRRNSNPITWIFIKCRSAIRWA